LNDYFHRNKMRIAENKNSLVGKVLMIFISSKILELLDKNLKTVEALFFEKIRVKISDPLILL
jgi:hypothetical protein